MNHFSRRSFLGTAGAGLAFSLSPLRSMNLPGGPRASTDRLITIFLRGGHDGVHTVVPVGDLTWVGGTNPLRPAQFTPPTVPLGGTGFAALNQDFQELTTNTHTFWANPAPHSAGHIAWIHQVGNPASERSHFTEQQIYETADVQPATSLNKEGFVPRVRQQLALVNPGLAPLWGASVSFEFQRMFRSANSQGLMAHIDPARLGGGPTAPVAIRQRLALPQNLLPVQTDLLAESVRLTSAFALNHVEPAMQALSITNDPQRFPQNANDASAVGLQPSQIGYTFMRDCEHALALALDPALNCQVVGVEVGGWDTHAGQVQQRAILDKWLAHALRSLYDLTVNHNDTFTILVMTEFGRTNAVNSTTLNLAGTDHGVGGLMTLIGRAVNGGVYNCRAPGGAGFGAPWTSAAGPFTFFNAQNVATDFRDVIGEILHKRFGLSDGDLNVVIPNFGSNWINCIN